MSDIGLSRELADINQRELELGILASCWGDDELTEALLVSAKAEQFTTWPAKSQYRALAETWRRTKSSFPAAIRTTSIEMDAVDSWEQVMGAFKSGDHFGVTTRRLLAMLDLVKSGATRQSCERVFLRALDEVRQPGTSLLQLQERLADELTKAFGLVSQSEAVSEQEALERLGAHLAEQEQKERENLPGEAIRTGLTTLDSVLGGVGAKEVLVVAARPGGGKTSFGIQIGRNAALDGPVLFLSLEMSERAVATRIFRQELQWAERKIPASMVYRSAELQSRNFWIDEEPLKPQQLSQRIAMFQLRHQLRLVVIDHLGILADESDYKAVTLASNCVRRAAKETGVPIVLLSQISRKIEDRQVKTPQLSDLHGSGAIEQDARKIVFIDRPWTYDKKQDPQRARIIVAKNSEGELATLEYRYNGPTFTFFESTPKAEAFPTHNAPEFEELEF